MPTASAQSNAMCVWGERAGHQTAYRITKEMFSDARGPDFGPKNQAPKNIGHQKNRGSSPEPTSARVHPLKTLMERNTPPPVSLRTGSEVEAARRGGEVFLGFPTEFWQPHCLQRNGYFMGGPSFDHTRPREQCRRYASICQHMVGQCTTAIGQHYCTFGSSVWNRWNALSNCEHEQTSRALAPPSATINRGVKAAQWRTVGGNRMYKGYVHIHSAGFFGISAQRSSTCMTCRCDATAPFLTGGHFL